MVFMRRSRTLRAASRFLALRTASLSSSLVLGLSSSLSDVVSSATGFFLTLDLGIAANEELDQYECSAKAVVAITLENSGASQKSIVAQRSGLMTQV
jgi:hypothetical protein